MILRDTVTTQGYSDQFPLYDEADACTPRYDVHVRIEPGDETVATLLVYDRKDTGWSYKPQNFTTSDCQRIAAAVWQRYGKRVPREVLA